MLPHPVTPRTPGTGDHRKPGDDLAISGSTGACTTSPAPPPSKPSPNLSCAPSTGHRFLLAVAGSKASAGAAAATATMLARTGPPPPRSTTQRRPPDADP